MKRNLFFIFFLYYTRTRELNPKEISPKKEYRIVRISIPLFSLMILQIYQTTNTKVSAICLGTMSFGAHVDESTAYNIMSRSLELGINFWYSRNVCCSPMPETSGITETIIGRWMKAENAKRKLFLATKVVGRTLGFSWIRGGESRLDEKNIEWQLKGAWTTQTDLYQLHLPDRFTKCFISNIFNLESERISGSWRNTKRAPKNCTKRVKIFGVSQRNTLGTMEFLRIAQEKDLPRMVSIQNNYSLLTQHTTWECQRYHKKWILVFGIFPSWFWSIGEDI